MSGVHSKVTNEPVRIGIFTGSLRYTFYPGTPLIQQAALVSTHEPDTAFYYDAGLEMTAEQDRRPGLNMESHISYYDVARGSYRRLRHLTVPNVTPWQRTIARWRRRWAQGALRFFHLRIGIFLRAITPPTKGTSGTAPGGVGLDWE